MSISRATARPSLPMPARWGLKASFQGAGTNRGIADMKHRIVSIISAGFDAVDGAHSAASKCHRVDYRREIFRNDMPTGGGTGTAWASLNGSDWLLPSPLFAKA